MAAQPQQPQYPSYAIERDTDIHKLMKSLIAGHPLCRAVSALKPLSCQPSAVPRQVCDHVDVAVDMYKAACAELNQGCDGVHRAWCVAGGYATYFARNTSRYWDIDIYVSCTRK